MSQDPAHVFDTAVGAFRGYISPVICLLGIVGNAFIILVFTRETKLSRFSVYCISLAICHLVILFTNSFLDDFLGRGLSYITARSHLIWKLDLLSNTSCKFMEYIPNVMYFASSNIILVFSIDRLLTIFSPIVFFSAYYINYALSASAICFACGLILNVPLLLSYGLIKDQYHSLIGWNYKCESLIGQNSTFILAEFALYNKVIVAFIIPTFLILILNVVICYKLWQINRHKVVPPHTKPGGLPNQTLARRSTGIFFSSSQRRENEIVRIFGHIAFNTTFLLLTMPLVIVMILRLDDEHPRNTPQLNSPQHHLYYRNELKHLSRLFSSVKDLSYAANFFIYLCFLPNFKMGFFNLFKGCTGQNNNMDPKPPRKFIKRKIYLSKPFRKTF